MHATASIIMPSAKGMPINMQTQSWMAWMSTAGTLLRELSPLLVSMNIPGAPPGSAVVMSIFRMGNPSSGYVGSSCRRRNDSLVTTGGSRRDASQVGLQ
jgi:hypothetical protein